MPILSITERLLAYADSPPTSNPVQRFFDWTQKIDQIPVVDPKRASHTLAPFETLLIFDGSRTLGLNGSTAFQLQFVTSIRRYRLTWTGAGAAPAFRVDRALATATGTVSFVVNANQTVTVTSSLGAVFGAVVVGDEVFVPGVTTGDTALFDPLNEGYWNVLSATATTLVLVRLTGEVFSGATQAGVPVATNNQFLAFSSSGAQPGDMLDLVAGFSQPALQTYEISTVTPTRVEFEFGLPIADETAVPGVSGLAVYSSAKRYLRVETDRPVAVRLNGDTSDRCRVEPVLAGDTSKSGWFEKWGPAFSMTVKNRSANTAKVFVTSVE